MSNQTNHEGESHGHTPAAWAAVLICIAGFLVGGVGLVTGTTALAIVGGGIVVLSPIVGKAMQLMGLGAVTK